MRDQLFDSLTDDVVARPLPAAEVRRLGDRLRHRRQTALGVAGLAVIAAIVVPVALTHSSSNRSLPPATPSPTPVTTVPADFPLADGLPRRDGRTHQRLAARPLTTEQDKACGTVLWSAVTPQLTTGGATVTYDNGSEAGLSRSLALYASATQARTVVDYILGTLATCPSAVADGGQVERVTASSSGAPGDAWVIRWTDAQGHFTGEGSVSSVIRVGNAVLLDGASFGGAGDDAVVQQEVDRLADHAAGVVAAMRRTFGD